MATKRKQSLKAQSQMVYSAREPSPLGRTLRRGRSASHEVSDAETTSNTRRGTKRQDRGSTVESAEEITRKAGQQGGTKEKIDSKKRRETLPTLTEDVSGQNESHPRSSAVNSELSGTTHATNRSDGDGSKLDADIMLDLLPDLYNHSSKMFNTLKSEFKTGDRAWIPQQGSKLAKRLSYYKGQVKLAAEAFSGHPYIKASHVLGSLLPEEELARLDPESASIEPVLQKANLAQFVLDFLSVTGDNSDMLLILQYNDAQYPQPFFPDLELTPNLSESDRSLHPYIASTFELGLELRTQYFISALSSPGSTHSRKAGKLLAEIFSSGTDTRGWKFPGLGTFQKSQITPTSRIMESKYRQQINRRIESIKQSFPDQAGTVNLVDLKFRFRWNAFLTQLLRWSMTHLARLERDIQGVERVQDVTDSIRKAMSAENHAPQGMNLNTPSSIAFLKRRQEAVKAREAALRTDQPAASDQVSDIDRERSTVSSQDKQRSDTVPAKPTPQAAQLVPSRRQPLRTITASIVPPQSAKEATPQDLEDDDVPGPMGDDDRPPFGDSDNEAIDPDAATEEMRSTILEAQMRGYEALQRIAKEGNKENSDQGEQADHRPAKKRRLLDAQPNPVRVSFSDSQELSTQQIPSAQPPPKRVLDPGSGKSYVRAKDASQADSEPVFEGSDADADDASQATSEAAFEPYNADADDAPRPDPDIRLPTPQPRVSILKPRVPTLQPQVSSAQPRVSVPQPRAAIPQPSSSPKPTSSDRLATSGQVLNRPETREASQESIIAVSPPRNWKPPKKRKAFSATEEIELIDTIEKYGCSWSRLEHIIKKRNSELSGRDQVALKDKARNIKFTKLRAKPPGDKGPDNLPKNFQYVTLSRSQKDVLDAKNIVYQGQ